jgi:hypothetical protein
MKLFLAIVFAPAAVYFVASNTHVTFHVSSGGAGGRPAAAKDVERVTAAAYRDHLDVALTQVFVTIGPNAQWTGKRAARIERRAPRLARRVGGLSDGARNRVAVLNVQTSAGRRFRAMVAEGLRRQARLYRRFAHDLATSEPTYGVVARWGRRVNALHRWYVTQLRSVVAAAPPEDRAAVEAAVLRY